MTDSIIRNSSPAVPIANLLFVHKYDAGVRAGVIFHDQLHGSGTNIVWRPTRKRSGTLILLFATSAQAWAAIELLSTEYTFTLTADVPELSMTFAIGDGELRPRTQPGFTAWTVDVPFRDVTP